MEKSSSRLIKFIKDSVVVPEWASMRFCEWLNGFNCYCPNYYNREVIDI